MSAFANQRATFAPLPPKFLTREQYAAELQVDVRTVDRLIRAGEIRKVNVGRSVRIPFEELERGAGTRTAE